jgi:hypothetical protein
VRASAADIVTLATARAPGEWRANLREKPSAEENADEASSPEVRSSGFGRVFGRIPDDGL